MNPSPYPESVDYMPSFDDEFPAQDTQQNFGDNDEMPYNTKQPKAESAELPKVVLATSATLSAEPPAAGSDRKPNNANCATDSTNKRRNANANAEFPVGPADYFAALPPDVKASALMAINDLKNDSTRGSENLSIALNEAASAGFLREFIHAFNQSLTRLNPNLRLDMLNNAPGADTATVALKSRNRKTGGIREIQIIADLAERQKIKEFELTQLRILPEDLHTFTTRGASAADSSQHRKTGIKLLERQAGTSELVRGLRAIDTACDIINTKSPNQASKALDELFRLDEQGSYFAKKYLHQIKEKIGEKNFEVLKSGLGSLGIGEAARLLADVKSALPGTNRDLESLRTRCIVQDCESAGALRLAEIKQRLLEETRFGNKEAARAIDEIDARLTLREIESTGSIEGVKKLQALAKAGNEHCRAALSILVVPPEQLQEWQHMVRLSDHKFATGSVPGLAKLSASAREAVQTKAVESLRELAGVSGLSAAECTALACGLAHSVKTKQHVLTAAIQSAMLDVSEKSEDHEHATARRTEALLKGLFNVLCNFDSTTANTEACREVIQQYAKTAGSANNRLSGSGYDAVGDSIKSHLAEFQARAARADKAAVQMLAHFAGGAGLTNRAINPLLPPDASTGKQLPGDQSVQKATEALVAFAKTSPENSEYVVKLLSSHEHVETFKDRARKLETLGKVAATGDGDISEDVRKVLRGGLSNPQTQLSALKGMLALEDKLDSDDYNSIARNLTPKLIDYFRRSVSLSPEQEKKLATQLLLVYREQEARKPERDATTRTREISLLKHAGSLCESMRLLQAAYDNYDRAAQLQEKARKRDDTSPAETHDKAARLAQCLNNFDDAKRHLNEATEIRRAAAYLKTLDGMRDGIGKGFAVFAKLPQIRIDATDKTLKITSDNFQQILKAIPSLKLASTDSIAVEHITFDGEKLRIKGEARYHVRAGHLEVGLNLKDLSCEIKADPKDGNKIIVSNLSGLTIDLAGIPVTPGSMAVSLISKPNGQQSCLKIEPRLSGGLGALGDLAGLAGATRSLEIPLTNPATGAKAFEKLRAGLEKKDAALLVANLTETVAGPQASSMIKSVKTIQKENDRITINSDGGKEMLGGLPLALDKTVSVRISNNGNELKVSDVTGARVSLPLPQDIAAALRVENPLKIDFKDLTLGEPDKEGNRTVHLRTEGIIESVELRVGKDFQPVLDKQGNATVQVLLNKGTKLPIELRFNPKQPMVDPAKIDFKLTLKDKDTDKLPTLIADLLRPPLDPALKEVLKGVVAIEKKGDRVHITRTSETELSNFGLTATLAKDVSFSLVRDKTGVSVSNIRGVEITSLPEPANLIYGRRLPIILNALRLTNPDNAGVRFLTVDSSGPLKKVVLELNAAMTPVDIIIDLENPVQALKNLMHRWQEPAWNLLGKKVGAVDKCRIQIKNGNIDLGLLKDIGSMFSDAGDLLSVEGVGCAATGMAVEVFTDPFSFKTPRKVLSNTLKGLLR